ncbi:hypothetical protein H4696_001959 [Amycolatopsis lexingtonensis]|uniref:Uncharacterized protein n=1 Tax=Amycolatopsis lexingtonensis TaxID=218822 RepID=A0ABR9HVA2_9PSEU|nr:hypothetical protein [Amycolatopsis lexingtonensis]MBE1494859.1 hypothetical protein [Amycolatopsis lexingtonensis]
MSHDRPKVPVAPPPSPDRRADRPKPAQVADSALPSAVPLPDDMVRAGREIRAWVAAERKPASESERLVPADPADRQHNFRVSYVVNYALKQAGAVPGREYPRTPWDVLVEKALWTVTALRQSDAKIGSSESLVLRDAQRYLYGSLGDEWLRKHVVRKYHVPPAVAPWLPGKVIDRGYEDVVKPADMAYNAAVEELTGRNPGAGRAKPALPHSRPGGEAWYDRGRDARPGDSTGGRGLAPFLLKPPEPARTPDDSASHLAWPPGHVDLGHGESVNLETGRYTPGYGPRY